MSCMVKEPESDLTLLWEMIAAYAKHHNNKDKLKLQSDSKA